MLRLPHDSDEPPRAQKAQRPTMLGKPKMCRRILAVIQKDGSMTARQLSEKLGCSYTTVKKYLRMMPNQLDYTRYSWCWNEGGVYSIKERKND